MKHLLILVIKHLNFFKKVTVRDDNILNIFNEKEKLFTKVGKNRTFEGLKIDIPDEIEKLEDALKNICQKSILKF